jgi:beta-glucosidase
VQLYTSDLVASVVPAVKQLKRFEKISLSPGEVKTLNFSIDSSDLAFVNRENQWVTETGNFMVTIDTLSKKFYHQSVAGEPLGLNQNEQHNNRKKNKQ